MRWVWKQSSGELSQEITEGVYSNIIATGYAGMGAGKNNPSMQCIQDIGPIPRGVYSIGPATNDPTPITLPLTSYTIDQMCGRHGFLIHGDQRALPGWASRGGIILGPAARQQISNSGIMELLVIE